MIELWVPKIGVIDSIANFMVMIDPCMHDTTYPVPADIADYVCPIPALIAGGECGAAESVEFVSYIGEKATNQVI